MNIQESSAVQEIWETIDKGISKTSLNDLQYKVYTEKGDPEIISLYEKWKNGKLILQPDFQRTYVWDKGKASRLIESVLLKIPLPIIYLSEIGDGRQEVIDGQQRLTSFFSFIEEIFPSGESFDLSNLSVFPHLNGMIFSDLMEEMKDIVRYYHLRTITILKESSSDIKFEIFERINTGSTPLNEMEIRNCMYRGPYLNLLKQLSLDEQFQHCIHNDNKENALKDVEMVIRFASFFHAGYLNYHAPMRRFINHDLELYQNISDDNEKKLIDAYTRAIKNAILVFGDHVFRRYHGGTKREVNGRWGSRINILLFDSWMYTFAHTTTEDITQHRDAIREGVIDMMATNYAFIDAIAFSTSAKERVDKRFLYAKKCVDEIINEIKINNTTCFSLSEKIAMFKKDPVCVFCGKEILDADDAAIAGIDRYWILNTILPDKPSLAHRYCNRHNV